MSRLSDTIANYTENYVRRHRQVRHGTYVQPRGLRRGLVQVGSCQQIVNADRLSDLAPDDGVLVASDGGRRVILSSRGKPGPSTGLTVTLSGTPTLIDDPPGIPGPERRGIFVSNSDPRNLYVVRFVANVPTEVEVTLVQPAGVDFAFDWIGTGNGRAIAFCSSGTGFSLFPLQDVLAEIDLLTLTINSTYEMTKPATDENPSGTQWNMSPPSLLGSFVYWVEIQPDNGAQTHTYHLMRAPLGFLHLASSINSLEVPNTEILPANDIFDVTMDDSFWKVWFAGSRWIWQGQVTAYNPLGGDPLVSRAVEFLTPPVLAPISSGATFTSYPRDGNLGGVRPSVGPDLLAARIGDDSTHTAVWPDTATAGSTDQFGNTYTASVLGPGNMDAHRGDITDPTPVLDVAVYDNPATLIGEFAAPKIAIFTGA